MTDEDAVRAWSTMLLVSTAAKAAHLQVRAERDAYREMIHDLLASAHPHPVEHPTMTKQWERAKELLKSGHSAGTAAAEVDRWRNCFICPECGRCSVDEDGLCVTCGGDCLGFEDGKLVMKIEPSDGPELSAARAEVAQLKAALRGDIRQLADVCRKSYNSTGLIRTSTGMDLLDAIDALIGKAGPL